MTWLVVLLTAQLGAFLFRVRGGFLPTGSSQLARALYAAGLTAVAGVLTEDWKILALFPALWVGAIFPWFDSIDLGRNEGKWERDMIAMAGRGVLFTLPAGFLLAFSPYSMAWLFAFAGLACPVFYEIAWRIPVRIENFRQGPELGEALFGAWIGGTLALALAP